MASSSLGVWHECWGYIGVLIFLAAVASLAVALRFWSRRITHSGIHTDDWLALFTLFVHHGLVATVLVAFLANGLGFNTPTLSTADARTMELKKVRLNRASIFQRFMDSLYAHILATAYFHRVYTLRHSVD
jgi:hypothetical protein